MKGVFIMALYNPENFIEDMQSHPRLQLSKEKSIKLCDQILKIEISGSMSWEEFNKELHTTLEEYLAKEKSDYKIPELKSDIGLIKVPDIAEINSYEGIISYLDVIKGNKIEENLKRFFLRSQLNDEEHNHFAQLFKTYSDMKLQYQSAFLCLYSELLLTQTITRKMLDFIISIFSKKCKGGINNNIGNSLSNGKEDYYIKLNDRISFLRLVFAITIVSPDDEVQESIDQSKNILLSVFGHDDYNPKSFVEMCYYYAILNMLSVEELEKLLRSTAVNVVVNLFSDSISELKKEKVEEYIAEKNLSLIEGFLDFRKYSINFCIPIIQKFNPELSSYEIEKIIENKLNKIKVDYFSGNVLRRDTFTYEYYLNEIEPRVNMYSTEYCNEDEFSEWMAGHRRFYEGYYEIRSKTRSLDFGIPEKASDVEQYAWEIVFENTLEELDIKGFKWLGKRNWKKKLLELPTKQERIMEMWSILNRLSEALEKYNYNENEMYREDKEKVRKVRAYLEVDREFLITAIIDRLDNEDEKNNITRSDYLLTIFKSLADLGDSASDFELDLSFDENSGSSDMQIMRWEEFNAMRYQDAMLYMCLNCDDPNEMFERINSTPGYSYYDN